MSSPSPASPPARGVLRSLAWIAAGLLITAYLYIPVTGVLEPSLDASNYASYAYFAAHHFQYGADVVPMYGPFGYMLQGSAYNGELFWARLAGQLAAGAGCAALILGFFHRMRASALRWLWLGLTLALGPFIDDMPAELAILLAGLLLLEPAGAARVVSVSVLLAFLSLIKGTHLLLALCTLGVVIGFHATQRRWRLGLGVAAAFVSALLLFWLLAGQSVRHLPAFFTGIVSLSSGYNAAMGLDEPAGVFWRGFLALFLLAAGIAWGGWHRRREPAVIAGALLLAGFTFVLWKHGFVRADGHIGIFHQYVVIAAVLWFLFAFATPAPEVRGRELALALMAAAVLAGWWIDSPAFGPGQWRRLVGWRQVERLPANLAQLLHPARAKAELDALLAQRREQTALRLIGEDIGRQPVDFFGVRHGIIPLTGLNYRPRPMGGGSFNAYNRHLMRLNRDFMRDPARRPPYFLLRLEPIDQHLGAQEDGLTLLELIARYQPVRSEDGYLLLRETPGADGPGQAPLASQSFAFSERVTLPVPADGSMVVARIKIDSSALGAVREFLYKAPAVTMVLRTTAGEQLERRLVPEMARSPFLLNPAVDNTADFVGLFSSTPGKVIESFIVETTGPWAYAETHSVDFYAMPRPPVARAPDATELLNPAGNTLFNVAPAEIVAEETQPYYSGRMPVQPLYAPGRLAWTLDGSEYELVFDHGLRPDAWERGRSNGVAFIVELAAPGAAPQKLFERLVDPVANPAERRTLQSRVALPPHLPGSRLVLRADPGPHGDNAWDWSYVTHVQLKSGLAVRDTPAVFRRPPVALGGNAPVPTTLGRQPVVLMHVPATIALARRDKDRRVKLEFGFMPGAYTGEGHTAGAGFVVELAGDDGSVREIFRRTLDPVARPADRGPQSVTVPLPAGAPGGRLVLRTEPVPGGSNSWGWTYFSRCDIE